MQIFGPFFSNVKHHYIPCDAIRLFYMLLCISVMSQRKLSFAPRARLADLRNEGSNVATSSSHIETADQGCKGFYRPGPIFAERKNAPSPSLPTAFRLGVSRGKNERKERHAHVRCYCMPEVCNVVARFLCGIMCFLRFVAVNGGRKWHRCVAAMCFASRTMIQ